MLQLEIYHSRQEDIDCIMAIYDSAKKFMRSKGNMNQWTGGYPSPEVISLDISRGDHYSIRDVEGEIVAVFTFIIGEDPTYAVIEDGEWPDNCPYGTIHRIASLGKYPGMLRACLEYCFRLTDTIRIDTHADNTPMLDAIAHAGFSRCGIIHLADGSPRIAFQKSA